MTDSIAFSPPALLVYLPFFLVLNWNSLKQNSSVCVCVSLSILSRVVFELFLQQLRLLSSEEERKEGEGVLRNRRGVEVEKSREALCLLLQHGSGTRILQVVAAQVSPGTYTKAKYREERKAF
jgi:hypothetical protein